LKRTVAEDVAALTEDLSVEEVAEEVAVIAEEAAVEEDPFADLGMDLAEEAAPEVEAVEEVSPHRPMTNCWGTCLPTIPPWTPNRLKSRLRLP